MNDEGLKRWPFFKIVIQPLDLVLDMCTSQGLCQEKIILHDLALLISVQLLPDNIGNKASRATWYWDSALS